MREMIHKETKIAMGTMKAACVSVCIHACIHGLVTTLCANMSLCHCNLERPWLFGMCDSHYEQCKNSQQVEEVGSHSISLNEHVNVTNQHEKCSNGGLQQKTHKIIVNTNS